MAINPQLDPQVVNLAEAIKKTETPGGVAVPGKTGEIKSRYQFEPSTWKSGASKYLGDPNAPVNDLNENKVAYGIIKGWKDKGFTPPQIASMWNAGPGKPNAYKENWRNTDPSKGPLYDTPAYVQKVFKNYMGLSGTSAPSPQTPTPPVTNQQAPAAPQGLLQKAGQAASQLIQPTFPAKPGEGALAAGLKTVGNLPASAVRFAAGTAQAINPYQTRKNIGEFASGLGAFAKEKGGILPALGAVAKEVPSAAYKSFVPQGIQQLIAGKPEEAQKTFTEDPFGQAAPVVLGLEGGARALGEKTPISSAVEGVKKSVGPSPEMKLNKAASTFRDVLQPTKGEISNMEVRKGRNIDDSYKLMAQEGVTVSQAGGKLDTRAASEQMRSNMEPLSEKLTQELSTKPKKFNLNVLKDKAIQEIRGKKLSALEKNDRIKDVNDIIDAEKEQRMGKKKGAPLVDSPAYNEIKQGLWKMAYRMDRPTANSVARMMGHIIKEDIEKAHPETKPLNEQIAKHIDAIQLLDNAHGRIVKGGRLGKMAAKLGGAVVGATTGVPVLGPLAGEYAGGKIQEYLTSPERATKKAVKSLAESGRK